MSDRYQPQTNKNRRHGCNFSMLHHISGICNTMAATMDRLSTRICVRDAYLCLAVHLLGLGVSSGREVEDRLRLCRNGIQDLWHNKSLADGCVGGRTGPD